MKEYLDLVAAKARKDVPTGHKAESLNEHLFDFQHVIVDWAVKRGRAAIFADTGLGKTLMQLSWADEVSRHTGKCVLVLAPLAVSSQTIEQGERFGIEVSRYTDGVSGVQIINYDQIHRVDFSTLGGIVLDESSILKSHDGKTRTKIIESSQSVPYRLSCTATPSPNDFEELGNQCEFLGVMSRVEMLATYFVNDTGDTGTWRLKGWGQSEFWKWMASWAVVVRSPADLGFDASRYELPPLNYFEHVVDCQPLGDELFSRPAQTLTERRAAQRNSINARCDALAAIVNSDPDEPWLIWCHLNDEAELLEKLIPRAVNVQGSDKDDFKTDAIEWFTGKKCVCGDKRFSAKLASCQHQNKIQTTSVSITQKTEKNESLSRSLTKKQMPRKDVNTTQSITQKTKKNYISKCESIETEQEMSGLQNAEKSTQTIQKSEKLHDHNQSDGKPKTQRQDLTKESKNMGLLGATTKECLQNRTMDVQFAEAKAQEIAEEEDSTLTTAITQGWLEDFCAPHAILESESFKTTQTGLSRPQCTCGAAKNNQVLVSKARMFGYGLNMQKCARMAFVGLDDSFEKFYQAVRRCYRFGQSRPVDVHIFTAENEGQILKNLKEKEQRHHQMSTEMVAFMADEMKSNIEGSTEQKNDYKEAEHKSEQFTALLGDCVLRSKEILDNSIDYCIFSPPFADLFVYSNSNFDMGNCTSHESFAEQFKHLVSELFRITKPGRNVSFHCMNLPTTKMRQGFIGLADFRGMLIKLFQDAGFIYHSEVCIWKDPVVAMQRTKALGLLHKTIRENGAMSRNGLPDYVVTMRKPGECENRIKHGEDLPVDLWQKYASPVWFDIDQGRTLNKMPARDDKDEKHMCPLQLDVIERCIHLWTNPTDLVFSPFMGIGSEGYCALKMGRKFIGIELKEQYYELAVQNISEAEKPLTGQLF